ncbi:MAG: PAS domain S-box protein [Asgard group archaeon]|nr:PAS domain S-box protein [Asgard group archaeon]
MKLIKVDDSFFENNEIQRILQENNIPYKIIDYMSSVDDIVLNHYVTLNEKMAFTEKRNQELVTMQNEIAKRVRGFLKMELPSGKFIIVDKFLEELSGFSTDEWYSNPNFIQTFIHPEFKDYYTKNFNYMKNGKVPKQLMYKIITKSGEERWWLQFNIGAYDINGKLAAISSVILDNTVNKESEIKYRNLFENINAGVFRTDLATGDFLDVNQKLAKTAGYSSIDEFKLKTKAIDFYCNQADREKIIEILRTKGKITDYEVQLKLKDGSIKWVSHSATLYPIDGYCEGLVIDITDRKNAEFKLMQNEERFRLIIEQSLAGILIIKDGKIDYANDVITKYSGYSLEYLQTIKPYAFLDLIHPDDQAKVIEKFKAVENDQSISGFYTRIMTKCGKVRWLSTQFKKFTYEDRSEIVAAAVDVTKRVNLETKLREERDLANNYFNVAGVILIVLDKNQVVQQINKRGCEILGYSKEEVLGKNWIDNFIPERKRKEVRQTYLNASECNTRIDNRFEYFVLTKSRDERLIIWCNTLLKNNQGIVKSIISSGEDITS